MLLSYRAHIMAVFIAVAGMLATSLPARAASRPSLSVQPRHVSIGKYATVVGVHLKANSFYTFLLAVPGSSKPGTRAFIPTLGKADARGQLRVRVRIPVLVQCGRVVLYAMAGKALVSTQVDLGGCRASSSTSAPPAPPAPAKGKKH